MPTGRGTPLSMFTQTPEAYDMKARLGAEGRTGYPLPEDTIPGEPLQMTNQDNNDVWEKPSIPPAPKPNVSRPTSGGIGGPLE